MTDSEGVIFINAQVSTRERDEVAALARSEGTRQAVVAGALIREALQDRKAKEARP